MAATSKLNQRLNLSLVVGISILFLGCDNSTGGYIDYSSTSPSTNISPGNPSLPNTPGGPANSHPNGTQINMSSGNQVMVSGGTGLSISTGHAKKILQDKGVGMQISIQANRSTTK